MEILQLGCALLREKCLPVTDFGENLAGAVEKMFALLEGANGIGLAAPQVGIAERFFVIHLADGVKRVFVNPSIIETSAETAAGEEGCLSIRGVFHDVLRPAKIRVAAQDLRGKPFTLDADAALARCIQHETDHLNGILYIDRLAPSEKAEIEAQFAKKLERRAAKKALREARSAKLAAKAAARGGVGV